MGPSRFDLFIDIIDLGPCRTCFFDRPKNDQKQFKIDQMRPRVDFVVLPNRRGSHFWPGGPRSRLARATSNYQLRQRGSWWRVWHAMGHWPGESRIFIIYLVSFAYLYILYIYIYISTYIHKYCWHHCASGINQFPSSRCDHAHHSHHSKTIGRPLRHRASKAHKSWRRALLRELRSGKGRYITGLRMSTISQNTKIYDADE